MIVLNKNSRLFLYPFFRNNRLSLKRVKTNEQNENNK